MAEACRWPTATRASSSACELGEGWRDGPRQGLHRRDRRRLRPLGRAADRRVDRQAGQGPRAGAGRVARRAGPPARRGAARRPVRARPGVLPLGVRGRGRRLDPRDQPVRPAGRPGGEGQDERGARRRATSEARARGSLDELLARRGAADYVAIQAFIDPMREGELQPLIERARTRRAASSPTGSARATCTRPASCTRAARPTGLFVQVVDDTGRGAADPGPGLRLRRG